MDSTEKLRIIKESREQLMKEIERLKQELQQINDEMNKYGYLNNGKVIEPIMKYTEIGKIKFKRKPKEGVRYLIENNLVEGTPEEVAKFLKSDDLSKKAIGEYLGDINDEFCRKVLTSYVQLFNFTDMNFVEGLRLLLNSFVLPGESQKIDEILMEWSERYYSANTEKFNNKDEVFILAFATIMLNTTLTNKTAQKQNIAFAKEEVFIDDMLNYENTNFNEKLLRDVYATIVNDPLINITIDYEILKNTKLRAKLWYQSGVKWKQRDFVLLPEYLVILSENEEEIRYKIYLENTRVEREYPNNKTSNLILLPDKSDNIVMTKHSKNLETQKDIKTFRFTCSSFDEAKSWEDTIRECINKIKEAYEPSQH